MKPDPMTRLHTLLRINGDWMRSPDVEGALSLTGSEVRALVHEARTQAIPIISGPKGYKVATTAEEIDECLSHMYSRARSIRDAAQGLVNARNLMQPKAPVALQSELFALPQQRRQYG